MTTKYRIMTRISITGETTRGEQLFDDRDAVQELVDWLNSAVVHHTIARYEAEPVTVKYRIRWRDLTSGATGCSEAIFRTAEKAQKTLDELNLAQLFPNVEHTVEPVVIEAKHDEASQEQP